MTRKRIRNFSRSMKPMKCLAIRRKEKNTTSTVNNTAKTGRMPNSSKKPVSPAPMEASGDPGNPPIHFRTSETAKSLAKVNIQIFLNKCLGPAPVAQDHAAQNSGGRIIRQNYIYPFVKRQRHIHKL